MREVAATRRTREATRSKKGRILACPGLAGSLFLLPIVALSIATPAAPRYSATTNALLRDDRVVKDRLHAGNNRNREDDSFLNAVGAVWPADIDKSAAGYRASTGFLIDRCHVLTNMHVVYTDDIVMHPSIGNAVVFGVGQTEGAGNRGALQGLRFLLNGVVVAHGDAIIVNHLVHDPANDWALIRLAANVDGAIMPMTIAAVDVAQVPKYSLISTAGFPSDRRELRGDQLELKDLWGSDGRVVAVVPASTVGAVIESTIKGTRGNSGSPLYADLDGHEHSVIGMFQGIRGNGIDVSENAPNRQILFTPAMLGGIRAAQQSTACT
jgi:V8-like Glu-specific endopeptidase